MELRSSEGYKPKFAETKIYGLGFEKTNQSKIKLQKFIPFSYHNIN